MGNRRQPTPIDEDVYERFKNFVEDVHGSTRGHLRGEIENALEQYRKGFYDQADATARIEDDVATTKALVADLHEQIAEAESDGGSVTPTRPDSDDEHTRAHSTARTAEKPAANQPRDDKVAWLTETIRDDYPNQLISKSDLRDQVRDAYGFRDDTVDDYVADIRDRLGAEDDPRNDDLLAWDDGLQDAREQYRDLLEREADADFSAMDDAADD